MSRKDKILPNAEIIQLETQCTIFVMAWQFSLLKKMLKIILKSKCNINKSLAKVKIATGILKVTK